MHRSSRNLLAALCLGLFTAACNAPLQAATPTPSPPRETATPAPTDTLEPSPTASHTNTATATLTLTPSQTPTASDTPTPEDTPTASMTPTPEPLTLTAEGNLNCRYGPSKAYLYARGLSEGDLAAVKGKNANGSWLWVQPHDTNWSCWVSNTAVSLDGDIATVRIVYPQLLTHPEVGPPSGVNASRSGSKITVSWNAAPAAVDLGYLIEARICLGTYLWDVAYSTTNTSYTIEDPTSCQGDSYGQLRVFNKLGYSTAVKIPWP